jgi:hypothetical protein
MRRLQLFLITFSTFIPSTPERVQLPISTVPCATGRIQYALRCAAQAKDILPHNTEM